MSNWTKISIFLIILILIANLLIIAKMNNRISELDTKLEYTKKCLGLTNKVLKIHETWLDTDYDNINELVRRTDATDRQLNTVIEHLYHLENQ